MGNEAGVDRRTSDIGDHLWAGRPRVERFYAWAQLDGKDFAASSERIANVVFAELLGLPGASIRIQMSLVADLPVGVTDTIMRRVTENAEAAGLTGVQFTVFPMP